MRHPLLRMLVIAPMPFECAFQPDSEGWRAECHELQLQVLGSSFEEAKRNMEAALQAQLASILRDNGTIAA